MCEVCDFNHKLQPATKEDAALDDTGARTIWGHYSPSDAAILAEHYPRVGEALITEISQQINHPRLLEVAGVAEMVERYLEGSFSTIRDLTIKLAANPLSILYWNGAGVRRVKTFETEMLHGPMEKLALRAGSVLKINRLLDNRHGMQLTFGCSCCVIAVATNDLDTLHESSYYNLREGFGRLYDSDVLTASGQLFDGVSVADVPSQILQKTADFHDTEVTSFLRFAQACRDTQQRNRVHPDQQSALPELSQFLTGQTVTTTKAA
ncbi:hypothetical protein K2P47_00830 [Patescibacteria group bacterium]|nr:hypothetical protein [Patescibacteria group bacterium]